MPSISSLFLLVGIGLVFAANRFMKRPDAPGWGSGPWQWPWRRQEWFTPLGFRIQLVGLVVWVTGALMAGIRWLSGS